MNFIRNILIIFIIGFCISTDVQASVTISGIDDTTVAYYEGVPTPTGGTAVFSVTNDFTNTLTITNIITQSVSAAYVSNSAGWTCNYTETSSAPGIEGETVCVPDSTIEIAPSATINNILSITFSYENLAGTSNGPSALSLSTVVNATSFETGNAVLGTSEWNLTVTDEEPVNPTVDPEKKSKVRGYVYFDDNDNDKRDDGEEGAEGIKIKLQYAGQDDKFDNGDDKKYKDKTNKEGKYRFDDLMSGRYRLKIENGQMIEFYLTTEKDALNAKSHFSLNEGETKERDFGYDRDRDSNGNPKNNNLHYLQSGFKLSIDNILNYLLTLVK